MLSKFIFVKRKSAFLDQLEENQVPINAIVFIEDTKEIWNHGTYFDGSTFDSSDIEKSIQNILETKQDIITDIESIRDKAYNSVQPKDIEYMAKITDIPTKSSQLENDVPYVEDNIILVQNGVYCVDIEGNCYTIDEWDNSKGGMGVALINDKVSILIALEEWSSNGNNPWKNYNKSCFGDSGYIPECGSEKNSNGTSSNDLSGYTNTKAILSQLSQAPAAEYCQAYSRGCKGAGCWYLPALGELFQIHANMTTIQAALVKMGSSVDIVNSSRHLSSTQYSDSHVLRMWFNEDEYELTSRSTYNTVLPICEFIPGSIKSRISNLEAAIVTNGSGNKCLTDNGFYKLIDPIIAQVTAVTNSNIESYYDLVFATISSSQSFGINGVPKAGKQLHVIVYNSGSSNITITLPTASPYICVNADNITVAAKAYSEINAISDGTKIYLRAV